MGLSCFACFDGGSKEQRREEERLASAEARAKSAEAAQKRQEQFEKSAAGRAARAQLQGMAKQSANSNKGEPVLKVLCLKCFLFSWLVVINGSDAMAVKFQKTLTEPLRNSMLPLYNALVS
ncbi:hypothetical protein DKX38_020442 [Salix brachista]|uniref:Uncharacterized protein n=1 Tax=Salix brachista TaxID=2182728 RepID=A0A5N5KAR6_9ROSI|nr:hypothetical protein DKX38_020442 [Salix brachista]